MPNTKKSTRKIVAKNQVLSQVAKTIRAKSGRAIPTRKTKHASPSNKTFSLGKGKQLLTIAYNGTGSEFVFQITNNGLVNAEYHVAGTHIINAMGIPIMVTPFSRRGSYL